MVEQEEIWNKDHELSEQIPNHLLGMNLIWNSGEVEGQLYADMERGSRIRNGKSWEEVLISSPIGRFGWFQIFGNLSFHQVR